MNLQKYSVKDTHTNLPVITISEIEVFHPIQNTVDVIPVLSIESEDFVVLDKQMILDLKDVIDKFLN